MSITTRPSGVGQRTAHDPGDPLVTSHCPFCGSGQVVGRSDGTIACDFCGQTYIVRVQPAFPGMPQMPMGPGAASDAGPDGGLVDPGMIGPDGMPAGGSGPPPGEDAEPGGEPDDSPGGGGDFPPSGEDDDDANGSGPPPKGKPKKKSSLRRYHGLEGQSLTEEQLLRHVAVRASGASPAVMARLRAEGRHSGRQVMAAWQDDLQPGDVITGNEQGTRLHAMREHMRGLGFSIQDRDKNGYENLGPHFTLDTGHHVSVGHSRRNEEWHATIHHPGDASTEKSRIGLNLGVNTAHVVPLLTRELGSQPVIGEMAAQWNRAQRGDGTPIPPRWRFPDGSRWHPQHRSFTARGAQPGEGEP